MSEYESPPNVSNTENLKTQESLEKEAEQPVLSVKEQIKNLEGEIEAHQQEIARVSTSIEETNIKLNEVREYLNIQPDEEDAPGTLPERDELEKLKAELQSLETQKKELVEFQENELREYLRKIDELDQSTLERSHAKECYDRLVAREEEFIGSEVEDEYWGAVSFELFHMAQEKALSENTDQAKMYFSKALEAARKGFDDDWLYYIQGTIHYLDNNLDALENVIDNVHLNAHVLQRLLEGLKQRGAPNYKEDY